jgi:tRNA threonylcarbamoyladenosine biosynthesis protein TsaB
MLPETESRILILETSGRTGEVALACGPKIIRHRLLDETRLHARDLVPAVSAMLNEEGWNPAEIQALIVNRGPGSYTGLRVGLMSAKAFAYATGCALLAVDGFAAIARQSSADVIDVIADAQRGLVYQQRFTRSAESQEVVPVTALQIVELSTWIQSLTAGGWVSGPGLWKFSDRMPGHIRIPPVSLWDPHAQSILEIGLSRYRAGERDDQWTLEPLYLRPSSAEEKWASKDQ